MHYPDLNSLSHIYCLEGEEWRDIKGYEGIYQVSNMGRVKSCARVIIRRNKSSSYPYQTTELIMKANNDSKGYPQVLLTSGSRRVARVHRLVAETFLAPPSRELLEACKEVGVEYVTVNHKDENKSNPNKDNLEWCTTSYNNGYSHDKLDYSAVSGSKNKQSILDEDDVSAIVQLLKSGKMSQERIAKMFSVNQITISNIWTGRSWSWFTGIPRTPRKSKQPGKAMVQ